MYWFNIWSTLIEHNYSSWIEENQKLEAISRDYAIRIWQLLKIGTDNMHDCCYNILISTYALLLVYVNRFIQAPDTLSYYIIEEITYMSPSNQADIQNPAKI